MNVLGQQIEALIFASDSGISLAEIKHVIDVLTETDTPELLITEEINSISARYEHKSSVMELRIINNGYQFLTKPLYYDVVNQLQHLRSKKKLTQAALETLAIIAYRQPITKLEIEQIRGVNCDYSVQRLLEKELIYISGKSDSVGRPILYSTSPLFMDYFGIRSTADLPRLKEIISEENTVGESNA